MSGSLYFSYIFVFHFFSPVRVLKNQSVNALNLIVHQLQPYDEGEYECEAESSDTAIHLKTLVYVVIKSMYDFALFRSG